jgi:2-polyprenyl-6-methoxyphenol hydroxylase-like FAD-dependent oxidoreductase
MLEDSKESLFRRKIMKYDMIVVGARCAGSSTALLLARKGYRVLLVDKSSFPSDIMSGHFIHPRGLACLQRWNVLDSLLATDTPRMTHLTMDTGPVVLMSDTLPIDGIDYSMGPRRFVLDALLVEAAVEAGVEWRENFAVQDLLEEEDGTVSGIRGRTASGETVSEHATMVIGADGMHSLVARKVNAPVYQTHDVQTCMYYSHWSNMSLDATLVHTHPEGSINAFPTNNDLTMVGVTWPRSRFNEVRRDIATHFRAVMDLSPALSDLFNQAQQEDRFFGTGDIPNFFRKPYGAGWALVGDAAYHKDPILAQGISDAFCDAERLVQAIDRGLSGPQPLPTVLAEYEERRNREALPLYEMTIAIASFEPNAGMDQLYPALSVNPEATRRFLGTMQGSVSIPEFFAPENIHSIIQAAHA